MKVENFDGRIDIPQTTRENKLPAVSALPPPSLPGSPLRIPNSDSEFSVTSLSLSLTEARVLLTIFNPTSVCVCVCVRISSFAIRVCRGRLGSSLHYFPPPSRWAISVLLERMTEFEPKELQSSKGSISEEDISTLLQRSHSSRSLLFRGIFLLVDAAVACFGVMFWDCFVFSFLRYSATTVLTLLQEVANFPGAKIDWDRLVKKTSTGISNAREYQMLWRHLAYRDALLDRLEDEAEPLVS